MMEKVNFKPSTNADLLGGSSKAQLSSGSAAPRNTVEDSSAALNLADTYPKAGTTAMCSCRCVAYPSAVWAVGCSGDPETWTILDHHRIILY